MEVDLDDRFAFLSHFMLFFLEDLRSSSGLKAELDDRFTFISRFIGGLDPCNDGIFGRFWMLLRDGSWLGRLFHVWSRFMLICWQDFGSSWELKANFGNIFTFFTVLWASWVPKGSRRFYVCDCGPKIGPPKGSNNYEKRDTFLNICLLMLGLILWTFWGLD